jgi:hypothetical protein
MQRRADRLKSTPGSQYAYQWRMERERLIEQVERRFSRRKETLPYNPKFDLTTNAENNVKARWIEQGIWNDKWNNTGRPSAHWKHKEPPQPEPEPTSPVVSIFGPPRPPKRPEVITEEQLASYEREIRASRPYYQFLFQVSKEREWIEDELQSGIVDIDAKAYENVKNSWVKQKIWNPSWGNMPGMTWNHEEPEEDEPGVSNNDVAVPANESRTNAAEDDARPHRYSLPRSIFGPRSPEANDD